MRFSTANFARSASVPPIKKELVGQYDPKSSYTPGEKRSTERNSEYFRRSNLFHKISSEECIRVESESFLERISGGIDKPQLVNGHKKAVGLPKPTADRIGFLIVASTDNNSRDCLFPCTIRMDSRNSQFNENLDLFHF